MRRRTGSWAIYCQGILVGTLYEVLYSNPERAVYVTEHEIEIKKEFLSSSYLRSITSLCGETGFIDASNTEKFIEERVVPKTRKNIDEVLKSYGLDSYDPWKLFCKNYGTTTTDYLYVDFDNHAGGAETLENWEQYIPKLNGSLPILVRE